MDEIVCDYSQFQIPNGSRSCMATSMCCARLFLDQDIGRADLHRVLHAGAALYTRWQRDSGSDELQYWTCVTKTFPAFLNAVTPVFESNGFFDNDNGGGEAQCTFDEVLDELSSHSRCAGVITALGSTYSLCWDGDFLHAFDSHGCNDTAAAVFRRTRDRDAFCAYVVDELVGHRRAEFSCVLFAKEGSRAIKCEP